MEATLIARSPPPSRPPKIGTAIQRSDRTNQQKLEILATSLPPLFACCRRNLPQPPAKRARITARTLNQELTSRDTTTVFPHVQNLGPYRLRTATSDHGGIGARPDSADITLCGSYVTAIQYLHAAELLHAALLQR
ncbi:hypothetical protein ACFW04_010055 [Cataglyphis niger]